ncbi:hypothetical protein L4D09_14625 [Photobacterium makurazakiensis]|uniref:hypothetical protein n=1 Tax=Photobacterium makurazakiensis TaxID=2910234 RepID=UPI003D12D6F4
MKDSIGRNQMFINLGAEKQPVPWMWGMKIKEAYMLQMHINDRVTDGNSILVRVLGTNRERTKADGTKNLGLSKRIEHVEAIKQGAKGYCFLDEHENGKTKKVFSDLVFEIGGFVERETGLYAVLTSILTPNEFVAINR